MLLLSAPQAMEAHYAGLAPGSTPGLSNATFNSLDWAGYVAASGKNPAPVVTAVYGSWVVQAVAPSKSPVFSTQWLGIGGYFTGDLSLIQTGSESYSSNRTSGYSVWWQTLPSSQTTISKPVGAGDLIQASIVCVESCTSTTQTWRISLSDSTQGWRFVKTLSYGSTLRSAEWIEERPTVCTRPNCPLTTLADFGTASYCRDYTRSQTCSATIGGATLPVGSLPYFHISMRFNSTGPVIAQPSQVTSDGTSFTVRYVG